MVARENNSFLILNFRIFTKLFFIIIIINVIYYARSVYEYVFEKHKMKSLAVVPISSPATSEPPLDPVPIQGKSNDLFMIDLETNEDTIEENDTKEKTVENPLENLPTNVLKVEPNNITEDQPNIVPQNLPEEIAEVPIPNFNNVQFNPPIITSKSFIIFTITMITICIPPICLYLYSKKFGSSPKPPVNYFCKVLIFTLPPLCHSVIFPLILYCLNCCLRNHVCGLFGNWYVTIREWFHSKTQNTSTNETSQSNPV